MAQPGIVLTDTVEITAGIVLRLKLVCEIVGKIFKSRKSRVQIHRFGNLGTQIMYLVQLPAASNQECLEEPFSRFLQQFDHRLAGSLDGIEQI
jgi:hypothetical protein